MKNIFTALSTLMVSALAFYSQVSFAQSESTWIIDVTLQGQQTNGSDIFHFVLKGQVLTGSYGCAAKGKEGVLEITKTNTDLVSFEPTVAVIVPSEVKFCPLEIWQPVFETVETSFDSTLKALDSMSLKNVNEIGNEVSLSKFLK